MPLCRLVLMLALAVAAPAAAEPRDCWRPGEVLGVFGWSDAPSRACRDQAASAPAPAPTTRGSAAPTQPANAAPSTRLTFSGEVYLGVGLRF